ncbi:MAG: hypothetical protein KY469_22320, partial [Actinobacteria bacterium]|nr:hypothetical protein [Actinomycetota bacterium]
MSSRGARFRAGASPVAPLLVGLALAAAWLVGTGLGGHDHTSHTHGPETGERAGAYRGLERSDDEQDGHHPTDTHHTTGDEHPTGAHGDSEGLKLVAAAGESVVAGASCDDAAPRRTYEIVSMAVDVTLNRYLDHDPAGRMYALRGDVEAIRREEQTNDAARAGG